MADNSPAFAQEHPGKRAQGLRIALFSGNYNYIRDGANKALNRLVGFLLQEGASVRIYSPTSPRPAFEPTGDLVSVPSFPIPGRSEYRIAPRVTRAIEADIRAFRPTHFHLSAPDWLGTSAQDLAGEMDVPVVTSLHTLFETYLDYYRLGFLSGWMQRRLARFYGRSDYVLVPNKAIADRFRAQGFEGRVGVWGRGVDREVFAPSWRDPAWRQSLGYREGDPIILFFGRLVQEKGLDTFADVIDELARRGHALRPLIVGEGPAASRMKARLPQGIFTGHLEGAALSRAIASSDILVNPSVTEAFGNVNLEAMSAGIAIVSASVDSAEALIEDGKHGLLIEPTDLTAYADAVERLIGDRPLRAELGRAAQLESQRHVWPAVLANVVEGYRIAATKHREARKTVR